MPEDVAPVRPRPAGHANAFDLLRLLGATAVLVEHSWVLTGHPPPLPAGSGTGFGRIGVGIFFLVSGFLISGSWSADPSLPRYAARRALRIYPAYAVVIVLSVFVLGPSVTSLSWSGYLGAPGTWEYLARNLVILPVDYDLPGVFGTVPEPGAVNGSLWTIRVETTCYVLVAALGLLGLFRRRYTVALFCAAALALAWAVAATGYDGALIPGALAYTAAEPIAYFGIGMLVRATFPRSRVPWWVALPAVAAWLLTWGTPVAGATAILAVSALTVAVAFRSPAVIHRPTGPHDLSYGIYLMSYPVQQTFAMLGVRNPVVMLGATVLAVVPLAAASWLLVERPALARKPGRRRPVTAAPAGP